jgi:hypothetical protein
VLDKTKSYLVNSRTQKIRTIARADSSFVFDEFSLSFVFVYKGDTITHLAPCRLDTLQTLLPLGTPGNPIRHGDVLPPYQELVKGNIPFNYKKLKKLLQQMKLEFTAVDLQSLPFGGKDKTAANHAGEKLQYMWVVTTACPEIKCRQLQISATNGKILADKYPE